MTSSGSAGPSSRDVAEAVVDRAKHDLEKKDKSVEELIGQLQHTTRRSGIWKYYLANFAFQLVLLGTELDMVGLGMNCWTYWQYDFPPIQILAFYAVIGFFGPLLCLNALRPWGERGGKSQEATPDVESGEGTPDAKRSYAPRLQLISFYHWCPCARFYMLLFKNVVRADVTALCTVNTLSSFTFGIFQLLGIWTTSVLGEPFTVFVLLNCVSQVLNWTITLSYSLTPIAKWMGLAAYVQSVNRRADNLLKEWSALTEKEDFMRGDHVKPLIVLWRDQQLANLP